ncbi:MAG TPA: type IX secretion system membrane protein PorP/SprF [Flavobacteriales bacterium]|nr:type IX secretion system membrane protein PorP/SprF [Flavobacteriales bacterium]HIA11805.1 type IX secretion system membrane protein PorP/SprF [Flavobacteriales bacterium]HIO72524.1 type IX secretion system membrane protein PorP/SprF [Flavobacteriales bacterium]
MKTTIDMKIHKKVLTLCCILLFCKGYAQDIHFSQFYQVPQLVNPSLTGVFNGDFRGIINYRDQWNNLAPYKSYSLGLDGRIFKKKLNDKFLGVGLFVYQDTDGDSKLSTTQVNLSISSVIIINKSHNIAAGIQGGFAHRKLDETDLRWGAQYNASGYAPHIASGESGVYQNNSFGDVAFGISWNYGKKSMNMSSNNHLGANAGIAMYHLNTPKQGLNLEKLHREFVGHAELNIGIKNTSFSLIPSFLYLQQGPLSEVNAGAMLRYTIKEESKYTGLLKETAVLLGAYYRIGDAFIPCFMFEIASYALGISYDITTSGLNDTSKATGSIEIFFRYITPNPFKYGKGTKYTPML